MKCTIIFYLCKRTDEDENIITLAMRRLRIETFNVFAAVSEEDLSLALTEANKRGNLTFVIYGAGLNPARMIAALLESYDTQPNLTAIPYESEKKSYLLEAGQKTAFILPEVYHTLCDLLKLKILPILRLKYRRFSLKFTAKRSYRPKLNIDCSSLERISSPKCRSCLKMIDCEIQEH